MPPLCPIVGPPLRMTIHMVIYLFLSFLSPINQISTIVEISKKKNNLLEAQGPTNFIGPNKTREN